MAIRVRKLAKELDRSPGDVLGLLIAIGFPRYRSAEDMLPDDLVDRVKRASRDGVRPVPVQIVEPERPALLGNREARPTAAPTPRPADTGRFARSDGGNRPADGKDLMSRLVPGVEPIERKPAPKAVRAPTLPPVPATDAERAALVADRLVIEQERAALAAEREVLAERRVQLDRALEEARVTADAHRAALEAAMAEPRPDPAKCPSLADLLTARGLRGRDEHERAVASLAGHRLAGDLLAALTVTDVPAVERILRERLVLVATETAPAPTGTAAVVVGPQRAEIQDAPDLQRALARLGERLLLHGLRRVAVVGGRPSFQKSLRDGLDPRVEIRFAPPVARARAEAESDVQRTDLVVLWGVPVEASARDVYASSRAVVVEVAQPDLASLLSALDAALEAG